MSFIFRRYPATSKRVIFYAREVAMLADADAIDSLHLLSGLLTEVGSRPNDSFEIGARFREEMTSLQAMKRAEMKRDRPLPLAAESKKILNYASDEADRDGSYWIDTDHLTLAVLRDSTCAAAAKLKAAGLTLDKARHFQRISAQEKASYGPIPAMWKLAIPMGRSGYGAGMAYLLFVFVLIKILTEKSC
jgi:ATP-dependent Clp protease ATP-binding subunit ClpA